MKHDEQSQSQIIYLGLLVSFEGFLRAKQCLENRADSILK